jgi:hypothetical protein
MATKYEKLYALTLEGAILTTSILNEWMLAHRDELTREEYWFTLSGSGSKRVFFKKGAATAELNRMPEALRKIVKITEYVPLE